MKKLLYIVGLLCMFSGVSYAEGISWDIPGGIGTVQLPGSFDDISPLAGYDFVQRQTIVGASATLLTLFKEINGYAGGVGEFHSQKPNLQPYLALGADVVKYVPGLNQFKSLSVQGFGRYSTSASGTFGDHLGAGLAVAYSFK